MCAYVSLLLTQRTQCYVPLLYNPFSKCADSKQFNIWRISLEKFGVSWNQILDISVMTWLPKPLEYSYHVNSLSVDQWQLFPAQKSNLSKTFARGSSNLRFWKVVSKLVKLSGNSLQSQTQFLKVFWRQRWRQQVFARATNFKMNLTLDNLTLKWAERIYQFLIT